MGEKGLSNFKKEITTVWTFPKRGEWKTHNSKYRGNFAPQIPRNLILQYTKKGDVVLDPMMGGGTTVIETKLLNRKGIGLDINPKALTIARKNIEFEGNYEPKLGVSDVRSLDNIRTSSIDLIITHPPYLDIINYSNGTIKEDLSNISKLDIFLEEFENAISEFYRVLKEDSYCAILIGDTRRRKHYIPLSFYLMERFLKKGFVLKEDIIKVQHNCSSNSYWQKRVKKYKFYLITHEHLFVFRKPSHNENLSRIEGSTYYK